MNTNKPAIASRTSRVALSELRRFDLASLFEAAEAPAAPTARSADAAGDRIVTLRRQPLRRLAPAA